MSVYMPKVEETYVYAAKSEPSRWLVVIVPHGGAKPTLVETGEEEFLFDEERTQAVRGRIRVLNPNPGPDEEIKKLAKALSEANVSPSTGMDGFLDAALSLVVGLAERLGYDEIAEEWK